MQFGVRTLLFIVLCICGTLAGYRAGFYQGKEVKRQQSAYNQVYYVSDLVTSPDGKLEDYDTLIDLVTSTIEPDSWVGVGGQGTLAAFQSNKSLVINQTGENHDKIHELFAHLRKRIEAEKKRRSIPR